MYNILKCAAFAVALACANQPLSAATQVFTLDVVDVSSGLGAGPFGTVSVQESAGSLIFTETLNSGYRIHDGNANHNALSFSLAGDPAVTVSNLTAGFQFITGVTAPPFSGSFDYAIDCTTACGHGYPGGFSGTLSFTVTANSGSLNLSSLLSSVYNGKTIYLASDVVTSAGATGNAGGTIGAVPEPTSWAMMISGFGLIGATMRRKRAGTSFA